MENLENVPTTTQSFGPRWFVVGVIFGVISLFAVDLPEFSIFLLSPLFTPGYLVFGRFYKIIGDEISAAVLAVIFWPIFGYVWYRVGFIKGKILWRILLIILIVAVEYFSLLPLVA